MKKIENIRVFETAPDYCFSDDENTALLWPETVTAPDGTTVTTIRVREHYADCPEISDLRIYNFPMPSNAEEYNDIILDADVYDIERI